MKNIALFYEGPSELEIYKQVFVTKLTSLQRFTIQSADLSICLYIINRIQQNFIGIILKRDTFIHSKLHKNP